MAGADTKPGRTVRLRAFLIDLEPVTNERFARFVSEGGYGRRTCWSRPGWAFRQRCDLLAPLSFSTPGFDAPDQPVAGVSWHEACAYARWAGKRLPTEAQWEKAARGSDGRLFPWGDHFPFSKLCNFNSNLDRTTPPGTFPEGASPFGLLDMAGNVNNWCRDWYWSDYYAYCCEQRLTDDPYLDDESLKDIGVQATMRADRGGGFATSFGCWEVLTCSGRLAWPPHRRRLWNSFRCIVEV
ncbi:formylglycine-generating enzyme family protein [Planctomycetota bacterium]